MPFLGRFALLSLSDGAGASHALTEDSTFLDFASPGSTVLGQMFPAIQLESKTLQGRFQVVLVALFGTALGPFTFLQLTKENLLWQSCAGHSGHMASPSQLCLCNQGGYAWHNCLAEDFCVRNSFPPLDPEQFSQTAQVEMVEFPGMTLVDCPCLTPI